jgi:ADP-glucose pyrophosphorylase
MISPKILAIILAGDAGNRMGVLTEVRAKPALPFGGTYRLIDFPLSNCVHSGIADVWVIEQFQRHSWTFSGFADGCAITHLLQPIHKRCPHQQR